MDMASTSGQMVEDTRVCGRMENSMERAATPRLMARQGEVSGKMERGLNGLTRKLSRPSLNHSSMRTLIKMLDIISSSL